MMKSQIGSFEINRCVCINNPSYQGIDNMIETIIPPTPSAGEKSILKNFKKLTS